MKNTALTAIHEGLGAKMVPFAGYNMPVQYEGINIEHEAVRNGVGVFDVSHMGEFVLKGEGALDLIQKLCSNDASKLVDGKAQYTCLPNENGGIVDDLLVYKMSDEEFLLVVNASNMDKDWNWISERNTEGVEMTNISDDISMLAVQGPKATAVMQKLTAVDLSAMKYYTFEKSTFAGIDDVIISATGYTGSGGFELYFKNDNAVAIWNALFEAGAEEGIKAIGLAARDTLRLEMGFCLYGNDLNDMTSPLEAGLGWVTKFTKNFTNSENLKKEKEEGSARKLVAFEMIDRGIPRHDYIIVNESGEEIGVVTSGTMSPSMKKAIGLGYVKSEYAAMDNEIFIAVRKKQLKAKLVKLPFYKKA